MLYTWDDLEKKVNEIEYSAKKLQDSNIVLFGAGLTGTTSYDTLIQEHHIYGFADNNVALQKTMYKNCTILSPVQLKNIENVFVIITVTAQHYNNIKKQLKDMNISHLTYAEYILKTQLEQFKFIYHELLTDERSKNTYLALLMAYLTGDIGITEQIFEPNQYFALPEFQQPLRKNEVFVDCGAYVGDVIEKFIWNRCGCFKQIYGFEPTPKIYHAMNIRKKRLIQEWALNNNQIITENKFIGNQNTSQSLLVSSVDHTANRLTKEQHENQINIDEITLDTYFRGLDIIPTFIKADVEGNEMALINGASHIIKQHSPLLAVCVYHNFDDLYKIPLKLKVLNPSYKMGLRHHTPSFWETVLYCF